MAPALSTFTILLGILSFATLGLGSSLTRRQTNKPFSIAQITIDPTFKGDEIWFYVSDHLSELDKGGPDHKGVGCIFSVPGIVNHVSGNKGNNFTVNWPVGDHLPCAEPSYSVSFVASSPTQFDLVLYHSVLYSGQTAATLRYLSVTLPDINSWPNPYGNNKQLAYSTDITGTHVDERPAPAGWTGESYPNVSP